VIRREKIEVRGKGYETFLVEVEMKNIGGVFEKSEKSKLQIWVTATGIASRCASRALSRSGALWPN